MDRDIFRHYSDRVRGAFARGIGCDVANFEGERLTVIDRPATAWPYTAALITFGVGTVISVDPAYRAFADATAPKIHYGAFAAPFLASIVAEGARRGQTLVAQSPSLLFTACDDPGDMRSPGGFTLREVDATWMLAAQSGPGFERGVGRPGVGARAERNRFAAVVCDSEGEPAAVAGVFDTFGMMEIGLDVVRKHRGHDLSTIAVRAATRAIIDRDGIPLYGCAPTNIRSHRTAESAGFAITCSDAFITPVGM
jgi:hypothetical protein